MTERYVFDPSIYHFTDTKTDKTYCEYNLDKVVDMLNEYDQKIGELEKLIDLLAEVNVSPKEESVKELLRNEIRAIDTVAESSAAAWNEYCILSNFFEEHYGEHWDTFPD